MATIRPSEERDREAIRVLLGPTTDVAFDRQIAERRVIHVAEENGQVVGISLALANDRSMIGDPNDVGLLGPILLSDPDRMDILVDFLIVKVRRAVALGIVEGLARVKRPPMVEWLRNTLGLEPTVVAWYPATADQRRLPAAWEFRVNLRDFLVQLNRLRGTL